jgi:hypothetical protein
MCKQPRLILNESWFHQHCIPKSKVDGLIGELEQYIGVEMPQMTDLPYTIKMCGERDGIQYCIDKLKKLKGE